MAARTATLGRRRSSRDVGTGRMGEAVHMDQDATSPTHTSNRERERKREPMFDVINLMISLR